MHLPLFGHKLVVFLQKRVSIFLDRFEVVIELLFLQRATRQLGLISIECFEAVFGQRLARERLVDALHASQDAALVVSILRGASDLLEPVDHLFGVLHFSLVEFLLIDLPQSRCSVIPFDGTFDLLKLLIVGDLDEVLARLHRLCRHDEVLKVRRLLFIFVFLVRLILVDYIIDCQMKL